MEGAHNFVEGFNIILKVYRTFCFFNRIKYKVFNAVYVKSNKIFLEDSITNERSEYLTS